MAAIILTLEGSAYRGRYVIEQDRAIAGPVPAPGQGPIHEARRNLEYVREFERARG